MTESVNMARKTMKHLVLCTINTYADIIIDANNNIPGFRSHAGQVKILELSIS